MGIDDAAFEPRITISAPSFDHTASDPLDLAMMRKHVNTTVAAAEKRA